MFPPRFLRRTRFQRQNYHIVPKLFNPLINLLISNPLTSYSTQPMLFSLKHPQNLEFNGLTKMGDPPHQLHLLILSFSIFGHTV